jgi:Protein of unknown function (DUF1573)
METMQVTQPQVRTRSRILGWRPGSATIVATCLAFLSVIAWATGGLDSLRTAYRYMRGQTIFVDSHMQSFGIVSPGQPISVAFRLTNRGQRPVRIVGCKAICSCTVPNDLPFTLGIGESRILAVSVDNPKREPSSPPESLNLGMTLFTNNPNQPRVPLIVKGEISSTTSASRSNL